jgi:hypothetical protein
MLCTVCESEQHRLSFGLWASPALLLVGAPVACTAVRLLQAGFKQEDVCEHCVNIIVSMSVCLMLMLLVAEQEKG